MERERRVFVARVPLRRRMRGAHGQAQTPIQWIGVCVGWSDYRARNAA